jgi:hypothetical protein
LCSWDYEVAPAGIAGFASKKDIRKYDIVIHLSLGSSQPPSTIMIETGALQDERIYGSEVIFPHAQSKVHAKLLSLYGKRTSNGFQFHHAVRPDQASAIAPLDQGSNATFSRSLSVMNAAHRVLEGNGGVVLPHGPAEAYCLRIPWGQSSSNTRNHQDDDLGGLTQAVAEVVLRIVLFHGCSTLTGATVL